MCTNNRPACPVTRSSFPTSPDVPVFPHVLTLSQMDAESSCRYETGNHLWLILEYCVGGDLKSLLTQDERLPESSVHDFGRDLLVALQFLHSRGIIHCDLKPSNIMMDEDGTIKLGGFSTARKLSHINSVPLAELHPVCSVPQPCT
jgi:serine/threonine-protein kinase ULK4